ncbi:MAG: DUF4388 domain-containing protein [Desulfobacteraceae bacterium]|nr:DUF4388 domain-containing protein [Desulfobacteraceae bacterium]
MSDNLEGKITGINLTNFLQIVQMEKPTVTLLVAIGNKKGALYIESGEIIDAETKSGLKHLDAAYEIISWDNSSIELKKNMPKTERVIKMPLMNILMEALRLKDEKSDSEEEFDNLEISIEENEEPSELEPDYNDLTLESSEQTEETFDEDFFAESEGSYDNLDEITFTEQDYSAESVKQEPDKGFNEEPDLYHKDQHDYAHDNTLEKYDLGADITPSVKVTDFTDYIVLPEPALKKTPEGEIKRPTIEDFIEKKSPWKKIVIASILALLIISSLGTGGYIYLNNKKIKTEYNILLSNIEKMDYEDQKINLLKKFISSYPESDYSKNAQAKLDSILKRTQKESYELMSEKIKKLPIDKNYKERASRYYQNFLQMFPEGQYAEKARTQLDKIPEVIREHDLETIKEIPDSQVNKKMEEIKIFKSKYPGMNLDELEKMEIRIGTYFFQVLQNEISTVSNIEQFNSLKEKINSFKNMFPNHPDNFKTSRLLKKLEDDKWADALLNSAKNNSSTIIEERQYLKDYIKSYDRFSLVSAVNNRIREIDFILNEKEKFDNIMSYASNSNYSVTNRINRLKAYVHSDIPSEYKDSSTKMLKKLESEYARLEKTPEKIEVKPEKPLIIQKNINDMIKDSYSEAQSAAVKIGDSTRFFMHGKFSFKDNITGKTWLILDSDDFSEKECFYYKDAEEAVKNMNIDGYSDWRLPTEQELLSLFKNKPFFPIEKNKWYWSKDIFEKGFNTYSAVITDTQTEQREKLSKDIFTDCGIFKAVRP